jgi:16S rRNA C967 or C1407 C5-methylase (RsmB/RsmF family)
MHGLGVNVGEIKTKERDIVTSEERKQYNKQYYLDNKEKRRQSNKQYRLNNKEKIKQYNLDNKEYHKEYRLKNKEKIKQYKKQYDLNNKEKRRKYQNERKKRDPNYKLIKIIRTRIINVLKGRYKSKRTIELLGCSIEEAWNHLESKFKPGMTKENHGLWHIDHIKPCASFDLTDPEQQAICFHYTNLQPLWAVDNRRKGSRYGTDEMD